MNEAIRDWIANVETTHYLIGSAAGPHPYPTLVRELQSVIGREARAQLLEREGRLPDVVVACVGGGSNAIGLFHPFRDDPVRLVGAEAGGDGADLHAASIGGGRVSVLHGSRSYVLVRRARAGARRATRSPPASTTRASAPSTRTWPRAAAPSTCAVTDAEALESFHRLCRLEGIIPALESAHALAAAERLARELGPDGDRARRPLGPRRQGRRHRGRRGAAGERSRTPALVDLPDGRRRPARAGRGRRPRRAPPRSRSASRSRDPLADGPTIQRAGAGARSTPA